MMIINFIETFGTDKQCKDFLIERRWGKKENAVCPHCNCKKIYVRNARMMFRCSACKKNFSVKVGTLFEGSNIKLKKRINIVKIKKGEKGTEGKNAVLGAYQEKIKK